jgi:hypothetical protein
MAVSFPTTFQQRLNESGFTFTIGETSVRSKMSIGAEKVRNRFTKSVDPMSCSIKIDYSEYQELYDFYRTTLGGGTLTFTYPDPFTQVVTEYRFKSAPVFTPMGGEAFNVSMSWEKIP